MTLHLPRSMRDALRIPLGRLLTGKPLEDALRSACLLVTVGDVVTEAALEAGVVPAIAVVDYRTKRMEDSRLRGRLSGRQIPVDNPAGTVTPQLMEAVTEAFKASEPVTIEVAGEDDLAALVCIAEGPSEAVVVYGQPDEGAVVVSVTAAARRRARDILDRMERSNGS